MVTKQEVERISQVYCRYRQDPSFQSLWDEENSGNQTIVHERQRSIQSFLKRLNLWPLTGKRILEVGCGSGKVLANLMELGAKVEDLYGVDLLEDRIIDAQSRYPQIHFQCANAEELSFPDLSFDLIALFMVFSSILDDTMARNVAAEVFRLLKPGGAVLWYDLRYNNPRNPEVRRITKDHIKTLFPELTMHFRTITLLPPLSRRLGRLTQAVYPVLSAIPVLRTHYLGLLIKAK